MPDDYVHCRIVCLGQDNRMYYNCIDYHYNLWTHVDTSCQCQCAWWVFWLNC